ncbi:MAG: hypothetical protein ACKOWF_08355 [Chloroflexota bacterium]
MSGNAADGTAPERDAPGADGVHQCRDCRGAYWVYRYAPPPADVVSGPMPRALDAMLAWWDALPDRGDARMSLEWQAVGDHGDPAGDPVLIAASELHRDGLTREGRIRLATALPPPELLWPVWWHPREPVTWVLWDEVRYARSVSERRGPRLATMEVTTAATDYGNAGDPAMYGPGPRRASAAVACAWWAAMLTPIHLARVALIRSGPAGAAAVRLSARDRADLDAPATVADPRFAQVLGRRAAVSRRILAALGLPAPPA